MMPYDTIVLERAPRGIAALRLNRPNRGNALNRAMLAELAHALAALDADETRVVVVRGSGRHFCAGADLAERGGSEAVPAGDEPADRGPGEGGRGGSPALPAMLAALDRLAKPTVAVVQGGAIGGGAALAACCDVVLATEEAFFAIPEVRIGMAPLRLAPVFIRAMGLRQFRRYALSGERIGASEALRIGLVHKLCAPQALDAMLAEIADALLHGAPGAMRELKTACAEWARPPWPANEPHPGSPRSPEAVEGILSFRDKRKPNWYPG